MTPIPARLMRAQAEACASRPRPTERQRARRAYILEAGRRIFAAHGRARVTLKDVAIATGLTQIAIRHQIADLDHLFALTLTKHLDEILAAIGAVPHGRPNLFARRRAEYFRVTRGICDTLTPLHFLFLRERFSLPVDELEPIEQAWRTIGFMLAGEAWQPALLLLDSPALDLPHIEAMLQVHATLTEQKADVTEAQEAASSNSETGAQQPVRSRAGATPGQRRETAAPPAPPGIAQCGNVALWRPRQTRDPPIPSGQTS